MKKILLIAWHEFTKHALRKRFIGALLAPLLVLMVVVAISFVTMTALNAREQGRVGVIDEAQALKLSTPTSISKVTFQPFASVAAARTALQSEQILAYYVLASDFATSGKTELVYWRQEPASAIRDAFETLVKQNVLRDVSPQVSQRLIDGNRFTFETADGSRKFGENNVAGFVLPLGLGILFLIALMTGTQYLMQAIVDEKENRTMEVVVTSVTPMQLMTGKIIGLGALGLFQVLVWLLGLVAMLALAQVNLPFLREVKLEPGFILVAVFMFVLNYLLLGALLAAVGAAVTDTKQAQSFSSPVMLLAISPEFFIPVILFDPNGIIATALSLFPLTAPLAMVLRYGLTAIPAWQIGLSMVLMALAAVGAFWLAGRIFRAGMLRFGQRLSLSEIAASLSPRS